MITPDIGAKVVITIGSRKQCRSIGLRRFKRVGDNETL
jgi:hypothetical protein